MKLVLDFHKANSTYSDFKDYIQDIDSGSMTSVDTNVAILQTVTCMVGLPISLILTYGIILYEHEGVDSQKRSVFNQLISAFFAALALIHLTSTIPITIRCWTGPLGHIFGKIVSVIRRFFYAFFLVNTIEIMIYKNLCLIKPNYILKLDDFFWAAFLLTWNGIFAILSSNADWYISSSNPRIYNFISGNEGTISASGDSRLFLGLGYIILSLVASYMIIKSIKKKSLKPKPVYNPIFNNTKHNPPMCSFLQILSLVIFMSIIIVRALTVTTQGPNGIILGLLPLLLTGLLVMPIQFYALNANLRRFVAKEIKERLGMDRRNQRVWTTNMEMKPNPQDKN